MIFLQFAVAGVGAGIILAIVLLTGIYVSGKQAENAAKDYEKQREFMEKMIVSTTEYEIILHKISFNLSRIASVMEKQDDKNE